MSIEKKGCVIDSDAEIAKATAALIPYCFDNIPETLAAIPKFTGWQLQYRKGRITKVPVDIRTFRNTQINKPRHYFSLQDAVTAYQGGQLSGIGFILDGNHHIVAVDIDHCIDPEGNLSPLAQEILLLCDSYTEISPSSTGLHIFFIDNDFGDFSGKKNPARGLEVYTDKRYLTVTGVLWDDTRKNVASRNGLTLKLIEKYFDTKSQKKEKDSKPLSDFEPSIVDNTNVALIIENIRASRQSKLFSALFDDGDISKYHNDNSSADMALMNILPFWTNGNPVLMEQIFSLSALGQRDKWINRDDYRKRTIQKALDSWNGSTYGVSAKSDSSVQNVLLPDLEYNDKGHLIPNIGNFVSILSLDSKLEGLIAYDKFSGHLLKRITPPWGTPADIGKGWVDTDDSHLRYYLSQNYNLASFKALDDAIAVVADKNSFHPVKDYLKNLPEWDGIPRAEAFFVKTLQSPDTEYTRSITFCWLKAAIKRVMYPGCKFDYCLVLAGSQGIGKSTSLSKLGRDWFNNSIDNINGKDAIEQLLGSWIVELGEMQATRKADNEAIKNFLSRTTDKVRLPYARRAEEFPRQCIFSATTNDHEPLKDKTGGRRFWILKTTANSSSTVERFQDISDDFVDQLWAEVYQKYRAEESENGFVNLLPSQAVLDTAAELQREFTEGQDNIELIKHFLRSFIPKKDIWDKLSKDQRRAFMQAPEHEVNAKLSTGRSLRQFICSAEIAYELFNVEDLNKDKSLLREINSILANLSGWTKLNKPKRMGPYGPQKNVYERFNPFKEFRNNHREKV